MHFSALTVLACALVSVTARPVENVAKVVAPVTITDVANKNDIAVANDILNHPKRHDDNVINVVAPVKAAYILNNNDVKAANHVARGAVNVVAPITLTDILNCNNIQIANDLLNRLSLELGCTLAQLGINAQDLVGANQENAPALLAKLSAAVQKLQGKRDLVNVWAPITITDILNCNNVQIANDILNNVAAHLGCTVEALGVTVAEILAATEETVGAILAKLNRQGKRDAVNVWAPITATDILNCNDIEIANHILNDVAIHLGCTLAEIGVLVEDILHATKETVEALLAKLNRPAKGNAVYVYAPITLQDILNCNTIEIANNLLNHLVLSLKCTLAELGVTGQQLVAAKGDKAQAVLTTLKAAIAKVQAHEKRDAVDAKAPVDVTNVANYNMVDILNKVGNGKRDGSILDLTAPVTATDIANGNDVEILNWIANGWADKRGAADIEAPVTASNIANYNMVDVLNNVGNNGDHKDHKRDGSLVNVLAPITLKNIANDNNVKILNDILNYFRGGKRDAVNVVAPITLENIANDNCVAILNHILNWSKGGKRDLVSLLAPITLENIANGNNVSILNYLLNWCKDSKRDLVKIFAPITIKNVANGNNVAILNNILNWCKGGN
ncbi:hypothetical protein FIBSPDRAFT_1055816 [Athelia psychrophila]|uniref:Uncharacterized protein n=1 Tax=Athelia psychrophila TaxID=1759441 RepID=A0A167T3K7_9AGAM|nr:hypothetical protein FIBSPDRAFT_1055816 [Fibularhizoctonia sp. CBS 109695]